MTETITVQKVARVARTFNNQTIWGVCFGQDESGNDLWANLYVQTKPSKGNTFTVNMTETNKNGTVYRDAKIVAGSAAPASNGATRSSTPTQTTHTGNGGRTTPYTQNLDTYLAVAGKVHDWAMSVEPDPSAASARMAIVNTVLIGLGEGKVTMTIEDEWGDAEDSNTKGIDFAAKLNARVKQEKNAAHDHLAVVLKEASVLLKTDPLSLFREHSPYSTVGKPIEEDMLYLTEKEAIQTRLVLEKEIDSLTNWPRELNDKIRAYCLRSQKDKFAVLEEVAGTRVFKSLDNAAAKKAVAVLKEKYGD